MTRLPAPNPEHVPAAGAVLTAGTPEAAAFVRQLRDAQIFRLDTWRLHQRNCAGCEGFPDDDYGGPGCTDGWRIWRHHREALERHQTYASLLAADTPPAPPAEHPDQLRLF